MSGAINPNVTSTLQTLGATDTKLQRTLSEVSTGKAVAMVSDDPATYVMASRLRSDAQAFMAVNSGLAGAEVPTRVASAAVSNATDLLMKLQATVFEAQSGGVAATAADTQIQSLLSQIAVNEPDATVNGVNLVAGAVVDDVAQTQINVPSDLDGATVTIGDKGLSQMNASLPGLGLANFTGTSDGTNLTFSSLSVENISTTPPATQIQIQTANYDPTAYDPADPTALAPTPPTTGETQQYPGQSWTFVFTDASGANTGADSDVVYDAAGNVRHVDHTIDVPLSPGFSLSDAVAALQKAMSNANFVTEYSGTPPTLSIAGNNVGTAATVTNLRPTLPILPETMTAQLSAPITASAAAPVTSLPIKLMELPPSGSFQAYQGATFLPTQAAVDAYRTSNPTTPAFYLSATPSLLPPPQPVSPAASQAISPGTTISSVDPAQPPAFITLSSGATANIPAGPPPPGTPGTQINLLVPPNPPTVTSSTWGGIAGALATIQSALDKTGDMAQSLGNSLNTLRQAEDHATQSTGLLNGEVGNLTDADMGKVSAQLVATQIQQQLAAQSLSIDNKGASLLLQLFK